MAANWEGTLRVASKIRCEKEEWMNEYRPLPPLTLLSHEFTNPLGSKELTSQSSLGECLKNEPFSPHCKPSHHLTPPSSPRTCKSLRRTESPKYRKPKKSTTPKQLSRSNSANDSSCASPVKRSNLIFRSNSSPSSFQGAIPFFQETLEDLWKLLTFQVNSTDTETGSEPVSFTSANESNPPSSPDKTRFQSDDKLNENHCSDSINLSNHAQDQFPNLSTPKMNLNNFFFSLESIQNSTPVHDSRCVFNENLVLEESFGNVENPPGLLSSNILQSSSPPSTSSSSSFELQSCPISNEGLSYLSSILSSEFQKGTFSEIISEQPIVDFRTDTCVEEASNPAWKGLPNTFQVDNVEILNPTRQNDQTDNLDYFSNTRSEKPSFGKIDGLDYFLENLPVLPQFNVASKQMDNNLSGFGVNLLNYLGIKPNQEISLTSSLQNFGISRHQVLSKAANNIVASFLPKSSSFQTSYP